MGLLGASCGPSPQKFVLVRNRSQLYLFDLSQPSALGQYRCLATVLSLDSRIKHRDRVAMLVAESCKLDIVSRVVSLRPVFVFLHVTLSGSVSVCPLLFSYLCGFPAGVFVSC